ncbi:hypothetical protein FQN60_016864 [Etheostoma spectabile]|uniref:C1q domain-containing protein n=2 Tax=Etheostoma spectabile TaxID=54343 RepID=A0A5J5CE97_9PERO|nr:hypothetical protein FQN60_016864 [Etheostoma spectabile]
MLSRLLGLLVLSPLCSAMLLPTNTNTSTRVSREKDPNTHLWNRSLEDKESSGSSESSEEMGAPWLPATRSIQMPMPMPPGQPWPPGGNMTDLRALGPIDPLMPPMPNMAICDMLMNQPVPPPIDQIPLFCICSFCKGTGGPKGDSGDRGPPGFPGSPGPRGMTGFQGRPGFTGRQGIKGEKGDMGQMGQTGPQGFTGTKGERGFKGEKGDQGSEGPPGSQGPQGETGTCPATCQSVQGPPGLQGVPGPAGARGLPGVQGPMGLKGLMGDKGDMGKPGEPGKNGTKGDQGERGLCMCKDGVNGTNGSPGTSGTKGDKGDTGAMGIQGPVGPKGNEGNMGMMGPPGPCSPAIQSAFSAAVNESFPAPDWPVPFPVVITNQQGHFNPIMGMYMAPVNGTYVFTFNLAVSTKPLTVGLFVNFNPVVKNTEAYSRSSTSQTIVLTLTAFDRVWLQVKNDLTNGLYTDSGSSSTFSGYLLRPDFCDMPFGRLFMPEPQYKPGDFTWEDPTQSTTAPPQQ